MDSGEINYYNPDTELFEPRDEYAGNTGKYAAVTLVPNYYINCNWNTVSAILNEFDFNESFRFNESVFDLKYFSLNDNFGFSEYPG